VNLAGGPGGAGGIRSGFLEVISQANFSRDVVVYDYRGAGLSEPRLDELCANQTVDACVPRLKAQGIDPTTFSSAVNAEDLRDLRKTLGYERWDVISGSYGTRLAQEAMRLDGQAIHAVIMTAPLPVGPDLEAEIPRTLQTLMERVFASCAAQPPCAAAYPTLEREFYSVYDELNAKPINVTTQGPGGSTSVIFDGARFLRVLRNRFSGLAREVPLLVHELSRGDRLAVARRLVGDGRPPVGNNTLTSLVACYDRIGPQSAAMGKSIAMLAKPPFRQFEASAEECESRRERPPDPGYDEPVSSDVPTLIFGLEFDHLTPTEFGRRIASRLKHAYVFEIPGQAHADGVPGKCPLTIASRFLADPLRAPDASCLTAMPTLTFELPEGGPVTLTFVIAAGGRSPFAGRWQAAFAVPAEYTFDLKIEGTQVSGAIRAAGQTSPIHDGRLEGNTISFRVTSPSGERVITFAGTLDGDRIAFTRDVEVRPGGASGGAALFGAGAGRRFTARRVN
jgi:pimeloyl-ACP methyl ester carboxylesterase